MQTLCPQDVLEFVDSGCNGFLSNICLVIASYNDMFMNRSQAEYVNIFYTTIYIGGIVMCNIYLRHTKSSTCITLIQGLNVFTLIISD